MGLRYVLRAASLFAGFLQVGCIFNIVRIVILYLTQARPKTSACTVKAQLLNTIPDDQTSSAELLIVYHYIHYYDYRLYI